MSFFKKPNLNVKTTKMPATIGRIAILSKTVRWQLWINLWIATESLGEKPL
jgi:hypothetical protein